jgi:hypothetical protein
MKHVTRALFTVAVCLIIVPAVLAQKRNNHPAASIGGVYGGFTANKISGDLDGMEVAIFAAGGKWRAIVQVAQGGAEDPEPHFVDVTVTGLNVEFSVGDMKYTGKVSASGLVLKEQGMLKRKACGTYFLYGP